MKESVGFTFLFNFFATFLIILFFALISIMNYMKAYKVNSQITATIEKYEGYNSAARDEIVSTLNSLEYRKSNPSGCKDREGMTALVNTELGINNYDVCIYRPKNKVKAGDNIKFGVTTYIYFDIPIINSLVKIPVYTTTDSIYVFEEAD